MKKRKKLFNFFFFGLIGALISSALYLKQIPFFNTIELKLKDLRFKTRSFQDIDKRIAIVAIDEKSIDEIGRWPWDRKIIAKLIDNLTNFYGAKTIALDMVFSEPSNMASDKELINSLRGKNNVVLGYFFREGEQVLQEQERAVFESKRVKIIKMAEGVKEIPLRAYNRVELNILEIERNSYNSGYFNIIPDDDGIIRKLDLLILYDGFMYPALSLSALKNFLGNEIIVDVDVYGVKSILVGNKKIPCDEFGRVNINYYDSDKFRVYSAVDILNQKLNRNVLENSLVFLGATEIGISDLRATPINPALPGVFIHATVASNVLKNHVLLKDGRVTALDLIFIFFFGITLAILLSFTKRTLLSLVVFFLLLVTFYVTNLYVFKTYPLNTSIFFPIFSTVLTYFFCEAYRNLVEERHSRFLKKAFSSYVSRELVNEIMKNPELLKLGGQKKEVTILFSDIRGFTTLSENMEPESLVNLLNSYLSPMTKIVLEHGGTLDKYIGDAIMALFNAPLDLKDHASLCCSCALMMIDKLGEINREFREKRLPEVDIGIGINTGMVIVGNMGTDVRFDYTAIGDSVNLASRLEGMNKVYGTHIIISEFTAEKIDKNVFKVRHLDVIKVKGKTKPVSIYELSDKLNDEIIGKYETAFKHYLNRDFFTAKSIFEELYRKYNDKPSFVFVERCDEYIKNPPDAHWEGVYVAKTK